METFLKENAIFTHTTKQKVCFGKKMKVGSKENDLTNVTVGEKCGKPFLYMKSIFLHYTFLPLHKLH